MLRLLLVVCLVIGMGSSIVWARIIYQGKNPGQIALTFDDGPNTGVTDKILDILKREKVKATFFVVGQKVLRQPSLLKRMAKEIEKKYLIREDGQIFATKVVFELYPSISVLKTDVTKRGVHIRQGYLGNGAGLKIADKLKLEIDFEIVETRLREKDNKCYLTFKSKGGLSRSELETTISAGLFEEFWDQTEGKRIQKIRLEIPYQKHTAEVDVYLDRDLIVAEVEVSSEEDAEKLMPLGKDISSDNTYKNRTLAK